jgi:hypothetical protein
MGSHGFHGAGAAVGAARVGPRAPASRGDRVRVDPGAARKPAAPRRARRASRLHNAARMKQLKTIVAVLGLGLALGACSGGDSCEALNKKLCAGKDDAACKKTRAWLDSEMTGPDGKKLSSSESSEACKMILDDKDALEAYVKQAADHAR